MIRNVIAVLHHGLVRRATSRGCLIGPSTSRGQLLLASILRPCNISKNKVARYVQFISFLTVLRSQVTLVFEVLFKLLFEPMTERLLILTIGILLLQSFRIDLLIVDGAYAAHFIGVEVAHISLS